MASSSLADGLRETLDVFDDAAPGTPFSTTEVAERLDVGRRSTYDRLERLADVDRVETKKIGARGRVWWRPPPPESGSAAPGASAGGFPTAEVERVFERIDDAFWALDDEFRFTYLNDRAEELLQRPAAALVGENVWEALPWLEGSDAREELEAAMAFGSPGHYEDYLAPTGRWYDVRVYPAAGGLSVYFRDVTERKERERRLAESERRNRTLVDNFPNGVIALFDRDLRHTLVGGSLFEVIDLSVDEIEGRTLREIFPEHIADQLEPNFRAVFDGESNVVEVAAGEKIRRFRTRPVRDDDGEIVAGLGMSQDVTERRRRERELERYETIVETIDDGVYAVDEDANFVLVNDALCAMVDYEREELIGSPASTIADESIPSLADRLVGQLQAGERDLATIEVDLRARSGVVVPVETRLTQYPIGDGYGRCGVIRDVSERIERERELQRYVEIVDAVGEPVYELDQDGRITFVNGAFVEYSGYSESELLGAHPSIMIDDDAVTMSESRIASLLRDDEPVRGPLEYEIETSAGERLPVENRISVLTDDDGRFRGSAGLLWDVTERVEYQRELERQREYLTALNELNEVVRGITDAAIEQSTREEIERTVCVRLADSDSYLFAWIGDVDGHTGTVNARVEAGVEGYLDGVTITVDPDDPQIAGPTERALVEGETQVSRAVEDDPSHDPWREEVRRHDYRASVAIPIRYDGTLFGALNVYTDRPNAFDDDELAVVGQLGEVVGHAISAIERKKALMSDEVVEVEFRIRNVFESLGVPAPEAGAIRFDRTVPLAQGTFLLYGTATGDAIETVEEIVETGALPHWRSLKVLSENCNGVSFELHLVEPPVISTAAAHGGYVLEARMDDGGYHMRVHLAPSANVRGVVDALEDTYPAITMVARRQVQRGGPERSGPAGASLDALTDRQRTAVEAAFYSGYFEWPRDSSGGDVAGSLEIHPSTFHHHLREAQRKLLEGVLATTAST